MAHETECPEGHCCCDIIKARDKYEADSNLFETRWNDAVAERDAAMTQNDVLRRALEDVAAFSSDERSKAVALGILEAHKPQKRACADCGHDDVTLGWCRAEQRGIWEAAHCRECCVIVADWIKG